MTTTDPGTAPASASTDRRLATIETVTEIAPIEGADAIERARIRGWDVVVKRDEFRVGDLCVYVEVDSMLDVTDPRFAFLAPRGVRSDSTGRRGHVLKTVRLRGQYSQGLALPVGEFEELAGAQVGDDVTGTLNIVKWDPPIPASIAGQVTGPMPGWIRKTDEERVQNLAEILAVGDASWVATEKVDGTSCTIAVDGDDDVVAGRNWCYGEAEGNTLWRLAKRHDIHHRLRSHGAARAVIQGEVYGEGIQSNPLRIKGQAFAAFSFHLDGVEIPRGSWPDWVLDLAVPAYPLTFPDSVAEALAQVEKLDSATSPGRAAEGVVWRAADRSHVTLPNGTTVRASFKVISNRYLLKHDR